MLGISSAHPFRCVPPPAQLFGRFAASVQEMDRALKRAAKGEDLTLGRRPVRALSRSVLGPRRRLPRSNVE